MLISDTFHNAIPIETSLCMFAVLSAAKFLGAEKLKEF